jgi:hypothetical protein
MADPSNPQPDLTKTLPDEILRDILHRATFIRHECDVSAASGLFCSSDKEYQLRAWKELLPFRITITCVSKLWHVVAREFLYASFHDTPNERKLESFASLLSAKPCYGKLVKRLSIDSEACPSRQARVAGILKRCPNLRIFSINFSEFTQYPSSFPLLLSDPSILLKTLQLDAGALSLSMSFILTLLARLSQLVILRLGNIADDADDAPVANYAKIVLPRLHILHLTFNTDRSILQFIRSLELPSLSAMCIGVVVESPISALPKDLSKRLEYLEFCFLDNDISAWEAEDFRNLRALRLHWGTLRSASVRSHLPMNQIVELISTFPHLEFKTPFTPGEEVEQVINLLLDPTVMPNLRSLTFDDGPINWDQGEERPKLKDEWIAPYIKDLATSFDQRGVDLWFNRPSTPWKEGVLVRDILCMHKKK